MTTKEAIQAMLDGKKIRVYTWHKNEYVYFDGNLFLDQNNEQIDLNIVLDADWKIYEEPKPKETVTIEKWLCKSTLKGKIVLEGDAEYHKNHSCTQITLIDTYEVTL